MDTIKSMAALLFVPLIPLAWAIHMYSLIRHVHRRQRELQATQIGWG